MRIKILSHNTYFGFREDPDVQERGRLFAAKRIYKKYDPDVLILTEAGYGAPNESGTVFDYAEYFGYAHATYVPQKSRMGIIILSKIPLLDAIPFTGMQGCAIRVLLATPRIPIDLLAIHPWFDLKDIDKITFLKPVLELAGPPAIIAGDFNALSHKDEYDKQVLYESFERFAGPDYKQLVNRLLNRKLLPYLEEEGFVDVLATHDPTYTIPTDFVDEDKLSPLRMDFFMVTPDIEVKKAKVIRGEDAEQASDHYPIYMEIDF